MITFYKTPGCAQCEHTVNALEDLGIACTVVNVDPDRARANGMPDGTTAPLLQDNEEIFQGHEAINEHFEDLEDFVSLWQKFQTDACYCDEQGNPE